MILKDIPETFFQVASTRRFTLHQQLDMLAIFIYQVLSVKGDVGGVVVDKSLRVHGGDGLDQCIAEYSNKRQLWVSSGIPLAMGNAALAAGAKHCIQEGAVYSIVETGLPFCLEDEDWPQSKDRESIKKLATLAAALGTMTDTDWRSVEAFGLCHPVESCSDTHLPGLAWYYFAEFVMQMPIAGWSRRNWPPAPPNAKRRLSIRDMEEVELLLLNDSAPDQFTLWQEDYPEYAAHIKSLSPDSEWASIHDLIELVKKNS